MSKLILIGAGGHSKVIQDIVTANNEFKLYAILDGIFKEKSEREGIIYGPTSLLEDLSIRDYYFCIAIGDNQVRRKLKDRFEIPIEHYATLIHPSAVISYRTKIGYGSVVMPNAVINADTSVGDHCIINSGAVVEHDNVLDDYVHVSPNATLAGAVIVGEGTHVGSGAVVIPGKRLGRWSIVGAGAVVVSDIMDEVTVVGVPGRKIP